ncbi:MAG: Lrp/AsnC ligand binding domain-containing protein [Chloroflexi bacterium]|nr:Lrp/AsnC ligand binding domain-containing protein [Chloroflexota bacterium]
MGAKAYVLVKTEADKTSSVVIALRCTPGVTTADAITGPYDAVAVMEGADVNAVGKVVLNDIRGIPGIRATLTCFVVQVT